MKKRRITTLALAAVTTLTVATAGVKAQDIGVAIPTLQAPPPQSVLTMARRNLGGPRLGVTYVLAGDKMIKDLEDNDMDRIISQFGWHFEYQVVPEGGGPQFVIQFVPMVGGVEYSKLLPSTAVAMGVRFPNGFEFGMGPELMLSEDGLETALVVGIGKTFDYSGVSIPINLVFTRNNDGVRVSTIFGYAIQKR